MKCIICGQDLNNDFDNNKKHEHCNKQKNDNLKCYYCGKPIRKFIKRFDWSKRCMHKKCWILYQK